MKARYQFRNGENRYEVYFCYQPYYGGDKYARYDDMAKSGEMEGYGCISAFLHSFYWGSTELIDMKELNGKPTISEIREFINDTLKFVKNL